jgi:hypothetical protein
MAGKGRGRFDWRALLLLIAVYVGVVFLWETQWVYPLKLIVVMLHEISHGIAALLTGGRVLEIQVSQAEGGHCVTQGGNGPLIYSAGYLGSLAFGVSLLLLATRLRAEQPVAALLGVLLIGVAVALIPWEANRFGKTFGILTGGLLVVLSLMPSIWSATAVRIVAVTSCLYAIVDIKSDVLDRPGVDSDAVRLAAVTDVSATIWGALWIVVSLAVTSGAFWLAVTAPPMKGVDSRPR